MENYNEYIEHENGIAAEPMPETVLADYPKMVARKVQVIPGLPKTFHEALEGIEEVEMSSEKDWTPLDDVLNEINSRYAY